MVGSDVSEEAEIEDTGTLNLLIGVVRRFAPRYVGGCHVPREQMTVDRRKGPVINALSMAKRRGVELLLGIWRRCALLEC
jgi:hypothetical protein